MDSMFPALCLLSGAWPPIDRRCLTGLGGDGGRMEMEYGGDDGDEAMYGGEDGDAAEV